ncbi:acetate--CoA ligase family protein [Mycobacterium sp. 21AC1]|uniref:acetate--CoA ligase family protein n=1 Tax=[Mycobacterium] appelbergii TaxID=2939269 RepID=UPI002938F644|nr:acetate--CoA ligase family protein [Mycobacterium sp. 21AC1]MDV3128876.1 acetate--CoA ligase family protein [Mycobacterium sp. 21AC1]
MNNEVGLVAPSSVAVVGASELGGKNYYGARVLRNLVDSATGTKIYAVNPRYHGRQVMGVDAFSTLSDLPSVPDLVIIAISVSGVVDVLTEAGELGVQTCVVLTRESRGADARASFEAGVRKVANRYAMRVIGPNSMGVLCGGAMVNGSFASGAHDGGLTPGSLSMISQSGSSISYLLQLFRGSGVGYSWLISTGDEAALSLEALFEQVVEDPATRVVLLFVEGITDGARFRRAALRARVLGKPVVLLQVGLSGAGREAVQTHTGRLAGVEQGFVAVAHESGMLRVSSYERFYDVAAALVMQAVPRGQQQHHRRAAVISTSGGAGAYTADCLSDLGWRLPPLSDDVRAAVESISAQDGLENPVDVTGTWASPEMLPAMLVAMAEDSSIDALVVASGAGGTLALPVAEAMAVVREQISQELYVGWVGMSAEVAAVLSRAGISAFPDPQRAVHAAEASARFRQDQQDTQQTIELTELLSETASTRTCSAPGRSPATRTLTAGDTLNSLGRAGVACAPGTLVEGSLDVGEVEKEAVNLGYPLAMKIDAQELSHKSDKGAVAIGITDSVQLRNQLATFADIARTEGLTSSRILFQRMVDGIEVLMGLKRDPAFGLLLVLGLGGVHAELFPNVKAVVLPATKAQLTSLVSSHPVLDRLLAGYRGAEPANREALIDMMQRFAEWGLTFGDHLREAEVNPVMVNVDGALAVDARAVFEEVGSP